MINDLPYYPGYEWRAVGDDLVLVALSTAIVTSVINGVFLINFYTFQVTRRTSKRPITGMGLFLLLCDRE